MMCLKIQVQQEPNGGIRRYEELLKLKYIVIGTYRKQRTQSCRVLNSDNILIFCFIIFSFLYKSILEGQSINSIFHRINLTILSLKNFTVDYIVTQFSIVLTILLYPFVFKFYIILLQGKSAYCKPAHRSLGRGFHRSASTLYLSMHSRYNATICGNIKGKRSSINVRYIT